MSRTPLATITWLPVACMLAAAVGAAESAPGVKLGLGGRSRAGSWTPLVVSGLPAGTEIRVAVQDPDGMFVRSPRVAADGGIARFAVRLGRPAGRVRIEQGDDIQGRHNQDDQPERLRDEVAGALWQPMADDHAHGGSDDDGHHVEQRPQPDHRARLATPSSTAYPDPPAATTR